MAFANAMKWTPALVALAVLAACGGGGGGGGSGEGGDTTPRPSVAAASVLEGNAGTTTLEFPITLNRAPSGAPMVMTYELESTAKPGGGSTGSANRGSACDAGVDYIDGGNGTVSIPVGSRTGAIRVTVCGDTTFEATETLRVVWRVSRPSGQLAVEGDTGSAIGTIVNDDAGGLNATGAAEGFGRDSNPLTNGDDDGRLGFAFASLPDAGDFQCTRDLVTGLVWEGKTGAGVRDTAANYTWAQLQAYVTAINTQALCGFTDWRLPTPAELATLVHNGASSAPAIDTAWLPNTRAAQYWTATTYQDNTDLNAWFVDFNTGTLGFDAKTRSYPVRLVSHGGGAPLAAAPLACADNTRFTDHGDGTVSDRSTGLMWKKCVEGVTGGSCTGGAAAALDWNAAIARPAAVNADASGAGLGYADWRLPTRAELASLAERERCLNPAINTTVFSNAEAVGHWTSTPYAFSGSLAWAVDFFDGQVAPATKTGLPSSSKRVRLVRAGQ